MIASVVNEMKTFCMIMPTCVALFDLPILRFFFKRKINEASVFDLLEYWTDNFLQAMCTLYSLTISLPFRLLQTFVSLPIQVNTVTTLLFKREKIRGIWIIATSNTMPACSPYSKYYTTCLSSIHF
mmetsp:Transcript_8157/g.10760  ORF Transcript_8157/g.10760 Transcript_8157/m.10760 type:complete len:126 (-) Transcript_8157:1041-1418(-)